MARSLARAPTARRLGVLALGALAFGACAMSGPRVQSRQLEAGEAVAAADALEVELQAVTYEDRLLTVRVAVTNAGETPAVVERRGILLAEGDLEYPVAPMKTLPVAETVTIAPGKTVELRIPFATAHRVLERTALWLRSVRRGDAWQEGVELTIPGAPAQPGEGAAAPEKS